MTNSTNSNKLTQPINYKSLADEFLSVAHPITVCRLINDYPLMELTSAYRVTEGGIVYGSSGKLTNTAENALVTESIEVFVNYVSGLTKLDSELSLKTLDGNYRLFKAKQGYGVCLGPNGIDWVNVKSFTELSDAIKFYLDLLAKVSHRGTKELSETQITQITELCEELYSNPDLPSVLGHIQDHIDNEDNPDFEVDGVRFINSANIDSILASELFDEPYVLGCFDAGFINDNTPLPIEAIRSMQSTESYEALGLSIKAMLDDDGQSDFAAEYASVDGYGHHFNSYDFSEEEINIGSQTWYVFDNRA